MPRATATDEAARVRDLFLVKFAADPALYVEKFHGIPRARLWDRQIEVMESVRDHKYTFVPAAHNMGKTYTASLVAWWWKMTRQPSKVVITAPGSRQAGLVIGNEIAARYQALRQRYSEDELKALSLHNPPNTEGFKQDAENFMTWFATKPDQASEHATKIAGFHSPHLLFIFEEFGGIAKTIYEATQGSMIAPGCRFLGIGNPSDPTSIFARLCRAGAGNVIHLDALECPNVQTGNVVFPWMPTKDSIEDLARYWGENSGAFQWKVRGKFPTVATDTLIGYEQVMRALARVPRECEHPPERLAIGCDVARFGDDRTTLIATCATCEAIIATEERHGQDTMATAGLTLALASRLGMNQDHAAQIAIDDTGVGGGVTDRLREQGWRVRGENFGSGPKSSRNEVKFVNRRTELWWTLREWVTDRAALSGLEGRTRDILTDELTSPKYTHKSDSRVLLEPKADLKERIGRSPDYGDALALAVSAMRRFGQVLPRESHHERNMTDDDLEDAREDEKASTLARMSRKWGPLGDRLGSYTFGGQEGGKWSPVE